MVIVFPSVDLASLSFQIKTLCYFLFKHSLPFPAPWQISISNLQANVYADNMRMHATVPN